MLIGHEDSAALGVGPLRKGLVVVHALQVPDVAVLIEEAQDRPRHSISAGDFHQLDRYQ